MRFHPEHRNSMLHHGRHIGDSQVFTTSLQQNGCRVACAAVAKAQDSAIIGNDSVCNTG